MQAKRIKSKFIGALLGAFVGDALGMPVEGYSAAMISQRYGVLNEMVFGRYTDDTQMMIGIAESLVHCKGFNGEDMAQRFVSNFDLTRGYGPGAMMAIDKLRAGYSWDKAGGTTFENGSYGNGSAMRIAPVGVFYHDNPKQLRKVAYLSSMITHAHPLGKEGGALQAYAIACALETRSLRENGFLQSIKAFLRDDIDIYHEKIDQIQRLLETDQKPSEVVNTLGNGITCFDSIPAAIYSFLSHHESFESAVVYAVNLGGDADTIGAMTGAISGAYHGYEEIPDRWIEKLENGVKGRDYVISLAEQLYETKRLLKPCEIEIQSNYDSKHSAFI
ncbi:MAG: ADP-ribosylglycohydrolase family protein [Candidatus Poribacteria bacterium]